MKFHFRFSTLNLIAVLCSFAAVGCQSEPEQLAEVTVTVPDKLQQDGIAWKKQPDVQPTDDHCLKKFFSLNQGLAGSPDFEGRPIVFTSGKKDRRFYWLTPAVDGVRWQCVEFRKRRFSVSDGKENPFE